MYPVLKEKHSHLGKGVLPVILDLKATGPELPSPLARLKKDHPLDSYKPEEIVNEFKRLTGEEINDVLALAGREVNMDNFLHATHLAIIHANNIGAPRGAVLVQPGGATTADASPATPSKGQKRPSEDDTGK